VVKLRKKGGGKMSFIKKPELLVLIGIPASGKSTLSEKYVKDGYLLLSSDGMRRKIYGTGFPTDKKERDKLRNFIYKEIREGAARALSKGKNVIIDSTNLTRKKRLQILRAVENIEAKKLQFC
jgi:predicted kinase